MKSELIGLNLNAVILPTGQIRIERESERSPDPENPIIEESITLSVEEYAQLVDYVVRAMASTLPHRSRR